MTCEFDKHFLEWVESTCKVWGYPLPSQMFYEEVHQRVPEGVKFLLRKGIEEGLIILNCDPKKGMVFTLKGLNLKKGPYQWFSDYKSVKKIGLNWEYFVQVAEFVRLNSITVSKGLEVTFEDGLMDIGVYKDKKLIICCEVKEKATQLQKLVNELKKYQDSVDITISGRGNDAFQKAKYIVKHRPEYFVGVAIGKRLEYSITYPQGKAFQLKEDIVPF